MDWRKIFAAISIAGVLSNIRTFRIIFTVIIKKKVNSKTTKWCFVAYTISFIVNLIFEIFLILYILSPFTKFNPSIEFVDFCINMVLLTAPTLTIMEPTVKETINNMQKDNDLYGKVAEQKLLEHIPKDKCSHCENGLIKLDLTENDKKEITKIAEEAVKKR